jgi:hypothetical protein
MALFSGGGGSFGGGGASGSWGDEDSSRNEDDETLGIASGSWAEKPKFANSSYSGADISVIATLNFGSLSRWFLKDTVENQTILNGLPASRENLSNFAFELGTVQTISCQAHRPKSPVRSLGNSHVRGYTRGPRTIAGSMIFTVLDQQSLRKLCKQMEDMLSNAYNTSDIRSSILPDQLLPVDLTFLFQNEYGSISRMALYGVEFLNHGKTLSIEDLLIEEVIQFVALDMDPMANIKDLAYRDGKKGSRDLKASDIFKTNYESYSSWLDSVNLRRRF